MSDRPRTQQKLADELASLVAALQELPEDLGLFDDLTVEEHLLLTGDIYGVRREETRSRTSQLLHALSLEHGRRTFAAACSHGMRKKTAFAMALLPNPQVLFLDEPFEAVDPVTAKMFYDDEEDFLDRNAVIMFRCDEVDTGTKPKT